MTSHNLALSGVNQSHFTTHLMPFAADSHPDAKLLRLGAQLNAEWAKQNELTIVWKSLEPSSAESERIYAEIDASATATLELADRIEEIPATTLDGLRVKAKALLWHYIGEQIDLTKFFGATATSDERLARSILHDLLAMEE